jgi:hypothetical protein
MSLQIDSDYLPAFCEQRQDRAKHLNCTDAAMKV